MLMLLGFLVLSAQGLKVCSRRSLVLKEPGMEATMQACISPPDEDVRRQCAEVIAAGRPSLYTAVMDPEEWARRAVHFYCCVMRQSEPETVYRMVFEYHQGCAAAASFLMTAPDQNTALALMAQFCPNSVSPAILSDEDRGAELFKVSSLQHETNLPVSNCGQGGNGDGKLTILLPTAQSDSDVSHFPAFIGNDVTEESWVSWMPVRDEVCDATDFHSMEGMPGHFGPVYSLTAGKAFVIEGLDEEAMLAKKAELTETGTIYQIINNNCSHKLLHILAAGMGCDAEIVPFYLPSALVNALESSDTIAQALSDDEIRAIESMIESFLQE